MPKPMGRPRKRKKNSTHMPRIPNMAPPQSMETHPAMGAARISPVTARTGINQGVLPRDTVSFKALRNEVKIAAARRTAPAAAMKRKVPTGNS